MMFGCPPAVVAGMLADDPGPAGMKRMVLAADRKPFMALWAERPIAAASWLRDICMFVRQEVIAGTGHFFQIERPDVTNALLLAFVDDVARDPRLEKLGLR
jgi:pimeloyl-ACP methyl ester carboxylesterase